MYNLYRIDEDLYQIHSTFYGEKSMEGTQLAILYYCAKTLGFDPEELYFAVSQMNLHNHDSAQFGINRTFIYSFNKKEKRVG